MTWCSSAGEVAPHGRPGGATPRVTVAYLDHAATAPLRPEVAAAMAEVLAGPLGNPSGSHPPAQRAKRLLEEARDEVAAFVRSRPGRGRLHLRRYRVSRPGGARDGGGRPGPSTATRWSWHRRGAPRSPGIAAAPLGSSEPTHVSFRSIGPGWWTSTRWRGRSFRASCWSRS